MSNAISTDSGPQARVEPNLHDRQHNLTPKTFITRWGLAIQDSLENFIARVSVNGDPPFYEPKSFAWVAEVESEWKKIRAELDRVMVYRDQMPNFQDILKEVRTIQTDNDWKTWFLSGIGMDCSKNAKACPETMRLIGKIPGMKTAFFSILSPHKHIPAHRGAYNGILRFHLGLIVPEPCNEVRIRVGNDFRNWTEGKALIFDDTFNHEVWNDTDGYRVVLFVDFARPLKQPWHWMNEKFLTIAAFAPFLLEAGKKQAAWQKKFYKQ